MCMATKRELRVADRPSFLRTFQSLEEKAANYNKT
jgi:hypothetical protein